MKPHRHFPAWLEITILIGLALIFGLTYWQYQAAQKAAPQHQEKQP